GATHRGDLAGRLTDAAATSISATTGLNAGGYRIGVGRVRDVVTIWQPGGLGGAAEAWARDVAARAGGRAAMRHRANIDIPAPGGWRIPLTLTTVEPATARALLGPTATAALERREAVLGSAAAQLRQASVGGTIDLIARNGTVHTRRIGAIVDDARLAWSELALATADAATLGVDRPFAVDVWGAPRAQLDRALAASPPQPTRLGVDRSWDAPDPDAPLASVPLKRVVGEVAYRPGRGDGVALDPAWVQRNIATESVPALGRVTCHRAMLPALRGALTEVVRAGLAHTLGRFGGCYNARLIRGGDSGGILSRHSFGIAVDVNVSRNTFGGRVELDGRVVEIFRRWGFAWGGTWVRADGMHLEWSP
ncbi:MAG TPA: M15 family metallopeptidase, partial [Acidimicrobiales bacterium]|nr:M15 family metallopeptidase [Acidimicrobiales bacterium]